MDFRKARRKLQEPARLLNLQQTIKNAILHSKTDQSTDFGSDNFLAIFELTVSQ